MIICSIKRCARMALLIVSLTGASNLRAACPDSTRTVRQDTTAVQNSSAKQISVAETTNNRAASNTASRGHNGRKATSANAATPDKPQDKPATAAATDETTKPTEHEGDSASLNARIDQLNPKIDAVIKINQNVLPSTPPFRYWLFFAIIPAGLFVVGIWKLREETEKRESREKQFESQVKQLSATVSKLSAKGQQEGKSHIDPNDKPTTPVSKSNNQSGASVYPEQEIGKVLSKPFSPKNEKVTKYAKTPDGNAFSVDAISESPDSKMIFELTIEGSSGSFRVSDNKDAQHFALDDPGRYLRSACDYTSVPGPTSKIITDVPGKLDFADNKWIITTKAKIDFSS